MRKSLADITADVAAILEESLALLCDAADSPFPTLQERVRIEAPEIAMQLLLEAPPEAIDTWQTLPGGGLTTDADGLAALPLPEDFLRLGSVRLQGWERPAVPAPEGDLLQRLLCHSRWPALRGTNQKPVAFIKTTGSGRSLIMCPAPKGSLALAEGSYLAMPRFDGEERMTVPERLYGALLQRLSERFG